MVSEPVTSKVHWYRRVRQEAIIKKGEDMLLAKIAGIVILIWFYQTAKKQGDVAFKWALTGLVGYWLVWWILTLGVANPMIEAFEKSSKMLLLLIGQLPALGAIAAAVFIRKKYLVQPYESKNSE